MATRPWLTPEETPQAEKLGPNESWALLERARIGRLAVRSGDGVDIFPVNFTVKDHAVYLRSAPGSKLVDIAQAPSVAFETDGSRWRTHWSVVLHGVAERMSYDTDIVDSGVLDLPTMTSSSKWNYIRITPTSITGRRYVSPPR